MPPLCFVAMLIQDSLSTSWGLFVSHPGGKTLLYRPLCHCILTLKQTSHLYAQPNLASWHTSILSLKQETSRLDHFKRYAYVKHV
jgi:hypothetical protein